MYIITRSRPNRLGLNKYDIITLCPRNLLLNILRKEKFLNSLQQVQFLPLCLVGQAGKILTKFKIIIKCDKFGRILGYVWIPCNEMIVVYCHNERALVNEVMIKTNHAKRAIYSNRKKLKYDSFLNQQSSDSINQLIN